MKTNSRWVLIGITLLWLFGYVHASNLRDPTKPLTPVAEKEDDSGKTKVDGIVLSRTKRLAIINGKFMVVGDRLPEGELVAILRDRVVLRKNGEMKVYFLVKKKIRN